jgi:Ca2+-binding RTX toxin-like protein
MRASSRSRSSPRRDLITCGGEADVALIDRFDKADKTCEVASRTTLGCETVGSFRANTIVGTARRDSICVFAGNDIVDGGVGNDQIDGGTGNDTLTGGPGRDLVLAGGGNDLIKLRDGRKDVVHCGSEVDLVLADRFDVAAADCERLTRSSR